MLCRESEPTSVEALAESLRESIASHRFIFQGELINVTASFGVIALRPEVTSTEEVIREAEQKLLEAKTAGRNCVRA